MEKSFEELQIKDDFMFSVVMRDPKFCKPFLERVLKSKYPALNIRNRRRRSIYLQMLKASVLIFM